MQIIIAFLLLLNGLGLVFAALAMIDMINRLGDLEETLNEHVVINLTEEGYEALENK